jgi:outer membrane murein-binding lipoprotein Lpp
MHRFILLAAFAATLGAAGCSEETCTEAQAEEKLTALMAKVQEVATANPEKLAEIAPQLEEIQTQAAAAGDDPAAACKAIDDFMALLEG